MLRLLYANNLLLGVQAAVGSLVPLVLVPHIVRTIGVVAFGDLAVALAWAGYGALVVQYAFNLTGPREIGRRTPAEAANVFFGIARAKLLLLTGVALAITAPLLFARGHGDWASWTIILVALPLGAALNSTWFLQASQRFLWVVLSSVAGSATALGIGFLLVDNGRHALTASALSLSIGPLVAGVLTFAAVIAQLPRAETGPTERPAQMLRQGWPVFVSQITSAVYMISGPIVVNLLAGHEAAGAYSAIERVINPLIALCMLTHTAAYPQLAALYSRDRTSFWQLMKVVIASYLALSSTLAVALFIFRDTALTYVLGVNRPEGTSALLVWGLLFMLISIGGTTLTTYLVLSGRESAVWPLTIRVLGTAIAIGLPATAFLGAAGWMAALALSQTIVIATGLELWRSLSKKEPSHGR